MPIDKDTTAIIRGLYLQAMIGDSDEVKPPREFFGMNSRKKREWEEWRKL